MRRGATPQKSDRNDPEPASEAERLLHEIEAYCRAHLRAGRRLSPATLCNKAVGNTYVARRLAAGYDVQTKTAERLRAYMADHPPPAEAEATS